MRVIFPDKQDKSPLLTRVLKQLPLVILITSCLSPFISYILKKIFAVPGILETLALSTEGIQKHQFWQWVTYPLVTADSLRIHSDRCLEITQRLLIRNVLCFIFLYQATYQMIRKLGSSTFLFLVVTQTLLTGIATWAILKLFHSSHALFGPECLISFLLLIWVFLDPEKRLVFPTLPITISRKWAFAILSFFYFFILILSGAFPLLFGSIFSMLLGIMFCYKEKIPNPYRIHFLTLFRK